MSISPGFDFTLVLEPHTAQASGNPYQTKTNAHQTPYSEACTCSNVSKNLTNQVPGVLFLQTANPLPVVDWQAFGARGLREWIRKGGLGKDGGRKRQEKPPPSRLRERPSRPATITRLSPRHKERHCTCTSNARAREERLDKVTHLTRLLKIEHHMYMSRVVSHFTDGRQRKKINRPISLSLSPLLLTPIPSNAGVTTVLHHHHY